MKHQNESLPEEEYGEIEEFNEEEWKDYLKQGNVGEFINDISKGWVRFWLKRPKKDWPDDFHKYLKTPRKWG